MMMMATMLPTFITMVLVISPQIGLAYEGEPVISIAKEEWELYKLQYNKTYENIVVEQFRMKIFMENKLMVLEHNQLFEQNLTTYEMEMNHLSDKLPHEVVATLNGLRGSWNESNSQFEGSMFIPPDEEFIQLPSTVDWRKMGVVSYVKNQGHCGSCWAFATTGALEGQHARKYGRLVSLSEQDLVDCCTLCNGCNGGLMTLAYQCIHSDGGINSDLYYPYEGHDNICRFNRNMVVAKVMGFSQIKTGSESALKTAVAVAGPIAVGVDASQVSFMHYKSGVYSEPHCSSTKLDHGMLVVGYGTDRGVDYWLVKNSWSSLWGDRGYIKIARNARNMCGIATMASYPLI